MVNAVSGLNGSVQLLKAFSTQSTARTDEKDEDTSLLTILEKLDPEKAATLKERLEEAKEVQSRLDTVKESAEDQRKAAAAQKIERIKAQIKALQLLAAANPEAAAKLAARLARELASAVKEYAAAGGQNLSGVSAGTGASASHSTAPSEGPNTEGPNTAGAEGGEAAVTQSANQAQAEAKAIAAVEQQGQPKGQNGAQDNTGRPAEEGNAAASGVSEANGKDGADGSGIRERISEQLQGGAEVFAKAKADQEFASEVRRLKNALKGIIETAKNALAAKQKPDPALNDEIKSAEKAFKEIDEELSEISPPASLAAAAVSGSVNVVI